MGNRSLFFRLFTVVLLLSGTGFCGETGDEREDRTFMLLPVALYTTDTGFGGGFACLKSYDSSRLRTSNIQLYVLYTVKKQFSSTFKWDHFFRNDRDRVLLDVNYMKFPTDFYGLGNDTENTGPELFTPEFFEVEFLHEHRFERCYRVKSLVFFRNQSLLKYEGGGLFDSGRVPWGGGRMDAGVGFALLWDSRDNILATETGTFAQLEYRGTLYQDEGNAFNRVSFDFRRFLRIEPLVLGSMIWVQDCRGDVPFYRLSDLGGADRLRGYEFRRFRARSLVLFQQDVRFPLRGPLGGALFAAAGRVADEVPALFSGKYHPAFGVGLRYCFNREDHLIVRLDFAWGVDSMGVYATFGEAF